ncbi:diacylglycerol kinase family protein [Staphylococcus sp. SQ8-PEA]|uniref:Diacylglycerol kinase family protein n=1 Tax=Staphylococcus marylandisciuri TaxID=2981529 RepID=A0ABT2QR10_9STAP|nr:diacylglycerol kinase family protein [Staphylococcus marylandisciuri]MCU5746387.1 diacylglycerol kinase family protein [Staphylococcus marylandisciuri]
MKRFTYAYQGLVSLLRKDHKFLLHCIIATLVIFFGIYFHINKYEWLIIILCIGLVLAFEAINTAVEFAVDLATEEYHLYAKYAKDIAATSVLIISIMAAIIGFAIFLPYIFK